MNTKKKVVFLSQLDDEDDNKRHSIESIQKPFIARLQPWNGEKRQRILFTSEGIDKVSFLFSHSSPSHRHRHSVSLWNETRMIFLW